MARVLRLAPLTLVADLASPDPAVDGAYAALRASCARVTSPADDRAWLGTRWSRRSTKTAEARASRVLASLVAAGDSTRRASRAVTRWYVTAGPARARSASRVRSSRRARRRLLRAVRGRRRRGPGILADALARRTGRATELRRGAPGGSPARVCRGPGVARDDVDGPTAVGRLDHVGTARDRVAGPVPAAASNAMRTRARCTSPSAQQPLRRGEPASSARRLAPRRSQPSSTRSPRGLAPPATARPDPAPRRKTEHATREELRPARGSGTPEVGSGIGGGPRHTKERDAGSGPPTLQPRPASRTARRHRQRERCDVAARGRARPAEAERALPMKLVLQVQRQIT